MGNPRKKFPRPQPPAEPTTRETKDRHPRDRALRAFGFEIVERRGDRMPRWKLRHGDPMPEDEAVEMMVECRVAGQ